MIEWFEELPESCPPKEAFIPNEMTVYRLSTDETPSNTDFLSFRSLNPERIIKGVDECTVRSLSVFDDLDACRNHLKLPMPKKKFKNILEINLSNNDGLIMKTFKDPNHYSWWRSKSFNVENVNKEQ